MLSQGLADLLLDQLLYNALLALRVIAIIFRTSVATLKVIVIIDHSSVRFRIVLLPCFSCCLLMWDQNPGRIMLEAHKAAPMLISTPPILSGGISLLMIILLQNSGFHKIQLNFNLLTIMSIIVIIVIIVAIAIVLIVLTPAHLPLIASLIVMLDLRLLLCLR